MERITSTTGRARKRSGYGETSIFPIFGAAEGQRQKQRPQRGGPDESGKAGGGSQKLAKKGKELKDEMDALVEEIDEVLEENAEEFVKNYVQRGGE
jgi:ubiquitin-like protein Pup